MKRILLLAGVLLLLASCRRELTLVSYNVGAFGKYTENSIPQVADILRGLGADLVGLNELDSCNRRHDFYQLASLADALGAADYHFASAFPYADGAYGNGIVAGRPILRRDHIALPVFDGSEPRSVAVIETRDCVFAATHLDHRGAQASTLQAERINAWFREHYPACRKPVFLCGDMNAAPGSATVSALLEAWEPLSPEQFTYDSQQPHICIDYIFRLRDSAPVRVRAGGVPSGKEDPRLEAASDHLPVYVKVSF